MKVFDYLTGPRGLAALRVVVCHLFAAEGRLLLSGRPDVDAFFMLSGCIISRVHVREFSERASPRTYPALLGLRPSRVYPRHLPITCVRIPLTFLPGFTAESHPNAFSGRNLVANILLTENWILFVAPTAVHRPGWSWNAPACSLIVEWFVYLGIPVMALLIVLRVRAGALSIDGMGRIGMLKDIAEFASGVALYRLRHRSPRFRRFAGRSCTAAGILCLAVVSFEEIKALSIFLLLILIPGLAERHGAVREAVRERRRQLSQRRFILSVPEPPAVDPDHELRCTAVGYEGRRMTRCSI